MKLGDPTVVGQMMRERRKTLGFTIEQMAEAVGLSPITIMRIELGRVGYIHAKTAKALEVPKKVTHRLVAVPTAVMTDGSTRPMSEMKAAPMEMRNGIETGDIEALPAFKRTRAPVRRIERAPTKNAPPLKRMLLWLAEKI